MDDTAYAQQAQAAITDIDRRISGYSAELSQVRQKIKELEEDHSRIAEFQAGFENSQTERRRSLSSLTAIAAGSRTVRSYAEHMSGIVNGNSAAAVSDGFVEISRAVSRAIEEESLHADHLTRMIAVAESDKQKLIIQANRAQSRADARNSVNAGRRCTEDSPLSFLLPAQCQIEFIRQEVNKCQSCRSLHKG